MLSDVATINILTLGMMAHIWNFNTGETEAGLL